MSRYFAIVADNKGEAVRYPFKAWVRENMTQLPVDFPKDGTTHEFKRPLLRLGWVEKTGTDMVFIIKPDENGSIYYAAAYLEELETESQEHEDENEEAQEMTFGLERDLQQALRKNIQFLEQGLEIIDGGKERHTEAGFIDITAKDTLGCIVVIELKAPVAKSEVIAQTLAYMEAVRNIENKEVRGIIIASDFSDRVKLAARQIPNLKLIKYAFQFTFKAIE